MAPSSVPSRAVSEAASQPRSGRSPRTSRKGGSSASCSPGTADRAAAAPDELVDRRQVEPPDERRPAPVVLGVRGRLGAPRQAWRRDRGDAAVGTDELARLLGDQLEHLLERVVGVEGERGVGEEARQLPRQLGLAAFVEDLLPRLAEARAGPSRTSTGPRGRSRPPRGRCARRPPRPRRPPARTEAPPGGRPRGRARSAAGPPRRARARRRRGARPRSGSRRWSRSAEA